VPETITITGWYETVRSRKGHYFKEDKSLCGQHQFAPCYSRSVQKPKCDACYRELIRQRDSAEEKAVIDGTLRIKYIKYRKDCTNRPWFVNINHLRCYKSFSKLKAAKGFVTEVLSQPEMWGTSKRDIAKSQAMDRAINYEDKAA